MNSRCYEKEKEELLSKYQPDQIMLYQKMVNEVQKVIVEDTIQYTVKEGTDTDG